MSAVMVPSVMRDKLKMGYTMQVTHVGENACRRIMDWDIEVKVFGARWSDRKARRCRGRARSGVVGGLSEQARRSDVIALAGVYGRRRLTAWLR